MYNYVGSIVPLTKIEVLRRVSQEDVYELVIGYKPIANQYIISPIREDDSSAGAWFEWVNGILMFKDFADPVRQVRDCFQFIMEDRRIGFTESLQFINEWFKLGLGTGHASPVIYNINEPDKYSSMTIQGRVKRVSEGRYDIVYAAREWSIADRKFWFNRYQITREQLSGDGVMPLTWYKFFSNKTKEWITISPIDVAYAYSFPDDYVKIYRPYREGVGKWTTNCDENIIGNILNIDAKGKTLIVTKSYKDCRVLRNEGLKNVIWFQNEGQVPHQDTLTGLVEDFEQIIIWFDNDASGIKQGSKVTSIFNQLVPEKAKQLFLPEIPMVKDPSDLVCYKSRTDLQQFLYQHQLLVL